MGRSSADSAARCGSQSPLLIVPGSPSTGRSTEEIWNDLNLSLLKDRDRSSPTAAANCFGGFQGEMLHYGFQELNRDKQGRNSRGLPPPVSLSFGSPAAVDLVTRLSLSCVPSPPISLPPHTINKRVSNNAVVPADKRTKRLMKNRESADRSRARKQTYRNELENEVAFLREENARLRSQQQKIWSEVSVPTDQDCLPNHPPPRKKQQLHRTLTAPF